MITAPASRIEDNRVTKRFEWRTQEGLYISPEDMETKHLFFTVRMIWNHSCPDQYKIYPYKRYVFPSFYTTDYIRQACYYLIMELATRKDELTPYMKKCLMHMQQCLQKNILLNEHSNQ